MEWRKLIPLKRDLSCFDQSPILNWLLFGLPVLCCYAKIPFVILPLYSFSHSVLCGTDTFVKEIDKIKNKGVVGWGVGWESETFSWQGVKRLRFLGFLFCFVFFNKTSSCLSCGFSCLHRGPISLPWQSLCNPKSLVKLGFSDLWQNEPYCRRSMAWGLEARNQASELVPMQSVVHLISLKKTGLCSPHSRLLPLY